MVCLKLVQYVIWLKNLCGVATYHGLAAQFECLEAKG